MQSVKGLREKCSLRLWHLNLCTSLQIRDTNTQVQTPETAMAKLNPGSTSAFFSYSCHNNERRTSSKALKQIESVLSQSQGWTFLESFLKNDQDTSLSLGNNDGTCRVAMKRSTAAVPNESVGAWTDSESGSKGNFSFSLF